MRSWPKISEVLFSLTDRCNLHCPHCITPASKKDLPERYALKFLKECKKLGIRRVGFTGGEPFLAVDLLCALVRRSVKEGMLFDRIMTNGVWFKDRKTLKSAFEKLSGSGYDGDICISVDAFHEQDLKKVALFIKTALKVWRRPYIISIASVTGTPVDARTRKKLNKLSALLKGPEDLSIRINTIPFSPIEKAEKIKSGWGKIWFKEDHCKGPGNIFFVEPSGDVKPCCGYATGLRDLTIGNIKRDSAGSVLKKLKGDRLICAIFNPGLTRIRKRLEKNGVKFPGKAGNNCYFCHYILKNIPKRMLEKCID